MSLSQVCGCGRVHPGNDGRLCPACQRRNDRRRNDKHKTSGGRHAGAGLPRQVTTVASWMADVAEAVLIGGA